MTGFTQESSIFSNLQFCRLLDPPNSSSIDELPYVSLYVSISLGNRLVLALGLPGDLQLRTIHSVSQHSGSVLHSGGVSQQINKFSLLFPFQR